MASSFDIIDCVGHAYRFAWVERRYLLRLAAVPVLVKVACQLGIDAWAGETDFVRQSLILLPSFFCDGWMLSHVIRYALFGQRWPFRSTGRDDLAVLHDKARGILTGTATYVLTRFLILGLMAAIYATAVPAGPVAHPPPAPPPGTGAQALTGAILLLVGGLWAFRLMWLFIPAAANVSMAEFLRRIRGFRISFYLVGAALVSFMPPALLFIILTSALADLSGGASAMPPSIGALLGFVWVLVDEASSIIMTFAIALGLRPALAGKDRA